MGLFGTSKADKQALVTAITEGDWQRLEGLLERDPGLARAKFEGGSTALLLAATAGDLGGCQLLLEAGADPDAVNNDGFNVLCAAAMGGNADVIRTLAGASARISVPSGRPLPLVMAVGAGHADAVQALLALGARVDDETPRGNTALFSARDPEILELLIRGGADVNHKNSESTTALHVAALLGDFEITRRLLVHGADRSVTDKGGSRPYDSAIVGLRAEADEWSMMVLTVASGGQKPKGQWREVIQLLGSPGDVTEAAYRASAAASRQIIQGMDFGEFAIYCRHAREELGTLGAGRFGLCSMIVFQLVGVAVRAPEFGQALVDAVLGGFKNLSAAERQEQVEGIVRLAIPDDAPDAVRDGMRHHYDLAVGLVSEDAMKGDLAELYTYLFVAVEYIAAALLAPAFLSQLVERSNSPLVTTWLDKHESDYKEVALRLIPGPWRDSD